MKKLFLTLALVVAVVMLGGCERENGTDPGTGPGPEIPTSFDIVGTSWQGVYNGTVQHPQAGTLPCILTWTVDFVDQSNVSVMLEMVTGGQPQQPQDMVCTYTYDGLRGEIISLEEGEEQRDPFEVDPVNRTFTIDFRITTGFSQENPQVVGGPTVFHQIH